ncbi:MAG: tetratricopeptide repeat protein, partial [Phycisphaerae bacterium]
MALLLVAVGAAVYAPSVNAPFLFDDHGSIVGNPHVRRLWPPAVAMSAPPQAPTAGRPIACASFALNYFFCGLNTRGYHAVNVALHLACALLLFGVVRRALPLLARAKDARPSGLESDERWNTRIAFAVALVWMLHPLQTDAVTYVTQRTELLVGFFYLATLYCFIRGCVSPRPAVWFAATFTSCALGMGSKEVMVSAPLTVILFDRAFVAGSFLNAWQQRRKLHTALAGTWMVLLILIAPGPRNASIGFDHGISAADYLRTQAGVLLLYLRLSFWPRPLVISYDDWPIAHTFYEVGAQCLAIAALLGATVWMLRHKPRAGFLGAWFFLILAPTSSFVPIATEAVAERRMYLPLISVIAPVILVGARLCREVCDRLALRPSAHTVLAGALLVALAVPLGLATLRRNEVYQDPVAIWRDALAKRPNNALAHCGLGVALVKSGRSAEAFDHFAQAVRLKPADALLQYNLGKAYDARGDYEAAIERYNTAINLRPDYRQAHNALGNALVRMRRIDLARRHYEQALRIDPAYL